ncbi:response regulator [Paenibacillus qinlingensis]|uniref:Two-component system response regulator YesN n=1 Tax=Paenibacillus qinlingensis TaxID=1837343 RepID=A0ABU1NRL4_9BACL|nr:response regulator [Paenibacillus qinlingensis]MDR6550088.1 two-component system response regulator YesN [Paenibacillus qinlingensis]
MYRLMIVDDEEHIREGLSDLVDWSSLGFQLVAKLEDGKQAVEWLQKTEIDIILSDVKMTHVSGLELAKYVHENHNKTKIVLISGFKEFDYVKQAMSYNVIHYLLKPTKLSDIRTVFQDVKLRLDKEKEENEQVSKVVKHKNELLPLIRKHLFRDLSTGKLTDTAEVEKLLRLTEVQANTLDHRCALTRISFATPGVSADSIEKMIRHEGSGILYVPIFMNAQELDLVALDLQSHPDASSFRASITSYMQTVLQRMHTLLGVEAHTNIVGLFENLRQLMSESALHFNKEDDLFEREVTEMSLRNTPQLAEQRKQFLAYLGAGNIAALSEQYVILLDTVHQGKLPTHYVKNFLIELFSSLSFKLNEMDLPIDKITNKPFYYETILRLNSYDELLQWGLSVLNDINAYFQKHMATEPSAIQKAKDYVNHYFNKDISLESAASQVYLSPDYLGRIFKQYTGSNFTDFVTETRIQKALEYLQDPQYKIYEIGSNVGYKNTKYFFKIFKKQTGYTPTEYRRKSISKDKQ